LLCIFLSFYLCSLSVFLSFWPRRTTSSMLIQRLTRQQKKVCNAILKFLSLSNHQMTILNNFTTARCQLYIDYSRCNFE
jgi:hypothetical protein